MSPSITGALITCGMAGPPPLTPLNFHKNACKAKGALGVPHSPVMNTSFPLGVTPTLAPRSVAVPPALLAQRQEPEESYFATKISFPPAEPRENATVFG